MSQWTNLKAQRSEIETAIDLAVNSPEPSPAAALQAYQSMPEVFDPEFHERGLAWIAREIRRRRAGEKRRKNPQMVIEEILGVEGLPAAFEVRGKIVRRGDLTPKDVNFVITDLRKQPTPLLEKMLIVRNYMTPYVKTGRTQINWTLVSKEQALKKARKQGRFNELQGLLDLQEKESEETGNKT